MLAYLVPLSANLAKEKSKRNEAEARLEKTRGEAVSHEERCRALAEELDDLRSKLTETTEEGRRAAKAELAELGSRLEEAERALSRRDKALADLNSQANEYESDRSARIDQMRHIEAKLTEVETVKDTVVRELKVLGVGSPEAEPKTISIWRLQILLSRASTDLVQNFNYIGFR